MKTHPEDVPRVLACGVDTLVFSLNVRWKSEALFELLDELKGKAKSSGQDAPGRVDLENAAKQGVEVLAGMGVWLFAVKPHGAEGYEWLLTSQAFSISIGRWMEPRTRPSMMVRVSSEALWMHGAKDCVARVLDIVRAMG